MTNKESQGTQEKKPTTGHLNRDRVLFFHQLFLRSGIREDTAERISEEVSTDMRFVERLVDSLVSRGIFQPRGEIYERVTLCSLEGLSLPREFKNQLERKRLTAEKPEEWCRLGRMFAFAGDHDRAALCHRTGFGLMTDASAELLVSLAESIDPARDRALALGCIDRVAEIILTGDQALDNPDRHDLTSEDPTGCAVLLDRACQAAIRNREPGRAASLARAATALFERCGLRHKLQQSLARLADALTDLEDFEGALRTVERRRLVLSAESEYLHVATCYKQMAVLSEQCGNIDNAGRYYELAIQVYESIIDPLNAALSAQLQGALFLRHGRLDDAVDAYERSIEIAVELHKIVGLGHLGSAQVWEAMGNFSTSYSCSLKMVEAFDKLNNPELLSQAKLQQAYFSVLLGLVDDAEDLLKEAVTLEPDANEQAFFSLIEGLIARCNDDDLEALNHFRSAHHRFKDLDQIDNAARVLVEIGHFLNLEVDSPERTRFFNALDSLGDLGAEMTPRIDILRGRIRADGELLQSLFSEAAGSDWTLFKLEAAEAIAVWAMANGRLSFVTRGVASALRTLAELLNRLDPENHQNFNQTTLLRRIVVMSKSVREQLHSRPDGDQMDSDSTAKISPAFVIDGLLAAVGRLPDGQTASPEMTEGNEENTEQGANADSEES
jgi:tetratricopeptide (TPR) repeat protein